MISSNAKTAIVVFAFKRGECFCRSFDNLRLKGRGSETIKLFCASCGKEYPKTYKGYRCASCGGFLNIHFKAKFPLSEIKKRKMTMWRYRESIPIENDENIVSFDEGFTPLLSISVQGKAIWVKQDHLFQSGSYKDRGASVLVSHLKEIGVDRVVEDSSGNAGAAVAAYCAKAGVKCDIFVEERISPAKILQITAYGAKIHKVHGLREEAAKAVLDETEKKYYASHVYNPYFLQGTKTFAYEVAEQLGWKAPDVVILPVGNGTLLLGTYIGFVELFKAKIVEKIPKIVAVQALNCAPLATAFSKGDDAKIDAKKTIAEGIAIVRPIRAKQILDAVKKTSGHFITVKENEIIQSSTWLAKKGYHAEPTAAATFAGVQKYVGKMNTNELIISTVTGHGLKHTEVDLSFTRW